MSREWLTRIKGTMLLSISGQSDLLFGSKLFKDYSRAQAAGVWFAILPSGCHDTRTAIGVPGSGVSL